MPRTPKSGGTRWRKGNVRRIQHGGLLDVGSLAILGLEWRDRLHSVGPIILTATTISDFARWLEEFVGHPIVDETGLAGTSRLRSSG